jgi:hypothetical protein
MALEGTYSQQLNEIRRVTRKRYTKIEKKKLVIKTRYISGC